jgi:hypothetical protein
MKYEQIVTITPVPEKGDWITITEDLNGSPAGSVVEVVKVVEHSHPNHVFYRDENLNTELFALEGTYRYATSEELVEKLAEYGEGDVVYDNETGDSHTIVEMELYREGQDGKFETLYRTDKDANFLACEIDSRPPQKRTPKAGEVWEHESGLLFLITNTEKVVSIGDTKAKTNCVFFSVWTRSSIEESLSEFTYRGELHEFYQNKG